MNTPISSMSGIFRTKAWRLRSWDEGMVALERVTDELAELLLLLAQAAQDLVVDRVGVVACACAAPAGRGGARRGSCGRAGRLPGDHQGRRRRGRRGGRPDGRRGCPCGRAGDGERAWGGRGRLGGRRLSRRGSRRPPGIGRVLVRADGVRRRRRVLRTTSEADGGRTRNAARGRRPGRPRAHGRVG